jgi:hypothetical protein
LIDAVEATDEPERLSGAEERVGPVELFFDLVFVFATTQVTQFIANNRTWEGLVVAGIAAARVPGGRGGRRPRHGRAPGGAGRVADRLQGD